MRRYGAYVWSLKKEKVVVIMSDRELLMAIYNNVTEMKSDIKELQEEMKEVKADIKELRRELILVVVNHLESQIRILKDQIEKIA